MNRPLPLLALLLGLAGLIPFLGFGVLSLGPQGEQGVLGLAAYAAVILAFLGGVHWGFALPEPSAHGRTARLVLGVVPSLAGWLALLLVIASGAASGLLLLVLSFIATTIVEDRGVAMGLMPRSYMRLRYGLTGIVVTVLLIVLVMRLFGARLY